MVPLVSSRVLIGLGRETRLPGWLGHASYDSDFLCEVRPLLNEGIRIIIVFTIAAFVSGKSHSLKKTLGFRVSIHCLFPACKYALPRRIGSFKWLEPSSNATVLKSDFPLDHMSSMALVYAFAKVHTTNQISGSTGHHRIVSNPFSDLDFMVRN